MTAELHATGCLVNHKKVMRLMREHGLTVRPRRRFAATTDSDHDGPIFPTLAKDVVPTGPNELWVADITYIAIVAGFVYVPQILISSQGSADIANACLRPYDISCCFLVRGLEIQ